jgi:hypothetical protein
VITLADDCSIGLIVNQILDIVEDSLTVTGAATQLGVECYATLQGQITEILDLQEIIDLAIHHHTHTPHNSHQRIDSRRSPQLIGATS